ncbi:MAG: OmpA family protein, partial [Longimicrobiales bacterium]
DQRNAAPLLELLASSARLEAGQIKAEGDFTTSTAEQPVSIRIAVDGQHVKLYANERRAINVPNADLGRSDKIYLWLQGMSSLNPWLISNLRIAAGGKDLYDALAADGRVATQGIFFDTGSDTLRPESTPTLKAIAQMLEEHEDLNLTIEGHTDNAGDEAANQNLSERRAASVRAYLVEQHGIDPERLEAQGFGESQPAVSNDTAEGRQQNRRVELVKR